MILGKLRMQRDVHIAVNRTDRPRLPSEHSRRSTLDGLGIQHAVAHDAQLAAPLRKQHFAGR